MTWNISNCATERDAHDNRKLSKKKATGKIDGAVALVMAVGGALNPKEDKPRDSYLAQNRLVILE